ncbi:MAG TPA: sulfite exporter TauE/SafE family protein, partial [Chryseosolibacter sp.]
MWSTAIIIGFAGSLHCVGMCSPLVMAVTHARPAALLNRILYNAGRIAVYGCMGAIISGAGAMVPTHGLQDLFSVALGVILLLAGIGAIRRIDVPLISAPLQHLSVFLKGLFRRYLKEKNRRSMLL